jgi:hypothetical protein
MTGNILIRDANGLSDKLIFDGSESLFKPLTNELVCIWELSGAFSFAILQYS